MTKDKDNRPIPLHEREGDSVLSEKKPKTTYDKKTPDVDEVVKKGQAKMPPYTNMQGEKKNEPKQDETNNSQK